MKKIAVGLILLAIALVGVLLVKSQELGGGNDKPNVTIASQELKEESEEEVLSSSEQSSSKKAEEESGNSEEVPEESSSIEQVEVNVAVDRPEQTAEAAPESHDAESIADPVVESEEPPASEGSQDQYHTDPVPEDKPQPVEPEDVDSGDEVVGYVSLEVSVDTLVNKPEVLEERFRYLIPETGVIFAGTDLPFYEGESAFDVLERTMRESGIHLAFRSTPMYNSAYIEGINNIYELAGGPLSGWMYSVNNWFPNYGMSRYQLSPGDSISMQYTLDLGTDIGGEGGSIGGGD